jgi:hypothetical protein
MEYISRKRQNAEIQRQHDHWNEVHQDARRVQKKSLEVSAPGDADEKEADHIARKVVNNEPVQVIQQSTNVNRSGEGSASTTPQFESQLQSTTGGQQLNGPLRGEMESKLNADLSQVKIHTSSESQAMSSNINAKAFTYGQDIHFNSGQFNPGTHTGKELLAHELVHTIQQGSGKVRPKIQRAPGDEKKTMEALLETNIINTIRKEDPPTVAHLEDFLNSEVGRRILMDFNIQFSPTGAGRSIALTKAPAASSDFTEYYSSGNKQHAPTTKAEFHRSIKSLYRDRKARKKALKKFDAQWEANAQKRIEDATKKFPVWNRHQVAAVSFSIAMLEQRADYLNDVRFKKYIEPEAGKNGKTTWLVASKVKADYPGVISDQLLVEMISRNPDMPINAKANLLAHVRGSQAFQYGDPTTNPSDLNTAHADPYSVGDPNTMNQNYDTLTTHPDFITGKKELLTPAIKDTMRAELEAKAQEIFLVLMPDEQEMPQQYLAAVGEGGTTTALGENVVINQSDIDQPARYDAGGKSRVGSGYFMYEEPDATGDMSGKQNTVWITYPADRAQQLQIFMYPYGFDNSPKPFDQRSFEEKDNPELVSQIRVTISIDGLVATIYFDQFNRGGTVALYDPNTDTATKYDINTIFPGATYLNNVLTLPNSTLYIGKLIKCVIDKPSQPGNITEELQMHISSDVKIEDFETKEYEGEFPAPTVANANSLFASANFLIQNSILRNEENRVMYENIQSLANSITDKDIRSFLAPGEHSLDSIFSITAGGVNPAVKKGEKDGMSADKLSTLTSLSDEEIKQIESIKDPDQMIDKLNEILGGDEITAAEMKKWRSVSGQMSYEGGTPKSKKYKYTNQTELDEAVKKHKEERENLKYKISIEGYTDPQGTHKVRGSGKSFKDNYNKHITSDSFISILPAHQTEFKSNMLKLMENKKTESPHNNNALSALRALAFFKLLLIEKAQAMDRAQVDGKTTWYEELKAKYPELTVSLTASRVKKDDVPIVLIFHVDELPDPTN